MSIIKEKAMHSEVTEMQTKTWGARARDWAEYQEIQSKPLYEAILNKCNIKSNNTFLDVGCGTGLLCQMASNRGARVSGFEASEPMLKIANDRVQNASFILGDMMNLPYEDYSFDIVTIIHTLAMTRDPVNALNEISRITKRGGKIIIGGFGKPEDCGAANYIRSIISLVDSPMKMDPFMLSDKSELENISKTAGLSILSSEQVDCPWNFSNEDILIKALLSPGIAEMAIESSGINKVKETIQKSVSNYKTSARGYHIPNKYLYIITTK